MAVPLQEVDAGHGRVTQKAVGKMLHVNQPAIANLELARGRCKSRTSDAYVEAMGGRLDIVAKFHVRVLSR